MMKVYASSVYPEVGLLKSELEILGIRCFIKNEGSSLAAGEIPFTDCYPELWVVNEKDHGMAQTVVDQWLSSKR